MRAMRFVFPVLLAGFLGGCANNTAQMIDDDKDLSWGEPIEDDYAAVVDRAHTIILRKYPLGLDPDRTKETEGDLWTVWRHDKSVLYRETTRQRARVKVEQVGQGKVRVGVAIVKQINDNIDNPTVLEEAKWVRRHRVPEDEQLLRDQIEQTWRRFEPSTTWKEKNRSSRRTGLRPDLVESANDVTLEDYKNKTITEAPKTAGKNEFEGKNAAPYGSHLPPPKEKKKKDDK